MQAVYAFRQEEESNYNISLEHLSETFLPDLNSLEPQNHALLRKQKRGSIQLFKDSYKAGEMKAHDDEVVKEAVLAEINWCNQQVAGGRKRIKTQMLEDTLRLEEHAISILKFVVELGDYIAFLERTQDTKRVSVKEESNKFRFGQSPALEVFANSDYFNSAVANFKISWKGEDSLVKQFYREKLLENQRFIDYCNAEELTWEDETKFVAGLIRKVLFKYEPFTEYFEELDVRWNENSGIVKGLCLNAIKSVKEKKELELMPLSDNWEEDKTFLTQLFDASLNLDADVKETVSKKLKNWEMDRVAVIDQVILEMGVAEMIEFRNIPLKVTINEFIEVSKIYSTPKSKLFINGILDKLSKELVDTRVIKKSGRGLIDNK